jgi:crotonobetainyl-CoA:carnitine CoA-transferase CaiB-like acyl-CoA transferase
VKQAAKKLPAPNSDFYQFAETLSADELAILKRVRAFLETKVAAIMNGIVVPLEGAGGKLSTTISSPIQVHGVAKVQARRAPNPGEHTDEILQELGFDAKGIEVLRASGAVPKAKERAA